MTTLEGMLTTTLEDLKEGQAYRPPELAAQVSRLCLLALYLLFGNIICLLVLDP